MILFLELGTLNHPQDLCWEIDPVTRARVPVFRTPGGLPRYAHGPALTAILAPFLARTEIVVTDWGVSWPEVIKRAELPAELRARMVDVVWLRNLEDYRSDLVDLHGSIAFWLKQRRPGYAGPWLCIDRQFHSWPEHARDRLIVGGGLGHPALRASMQRQVQMAYARAAGPHPLGGT